MPVSSALRAAFSAAIWAAYGVLLREPFQPDAPADDHAMTFPAGSAIEMIVLLKDALMCAVPRGTTRRSRRLRGAAFASAAPSALAAAGLPFCSSFAASGLARFSSCFA